MTLNNSIKDYRIQKGLTQEELASTLLVSRQTIIAIEKGNYIPSLLLAMHIANFFGVTVESIFVIKP